MEQLHPNPQTFRDLLVWQKAHRLTLEVYRLTQSFPPHEIYGLTNQLRRAAASTAANITEGVKRRAVNDRCRFLNIAEASNEESKYFLLLAKDLSYVSQESYSSAYQLAEDVSALLHRLIRSLYGSR